jgi:pilus assembly protein CpaB
VKVPAGTSPDQEKQMLMAAANRPADGNTTFSTGGDVSRFQRRTVPAKPQVAMASMPAGGPAGAAAAAPANDGVRVVRGNSVN